jgi:hypothetical protein
VGHGLHRSNRSSGTPDRLGRNPDGPISREPG